MQERIKTYNQKKTVKKVVKIFGEKVENWNF